MGIEVVSGITIATATGLTGLDATSIFSVACWFKTNFGLDNVDSDIFIHKSSSGNQDGYDFVWAGGTPQIKLRTWNGVTATTYGSAVYKGRTPGAGGWNHLGVSIDGSFVRFFVNGLLVSVSAQTANATVAGTRETTIANKPIFGAHAQGQYDLRVWSGYALNPAEVAYIARGGVLGNETARWFVGGSKGRDLSKNGNHVTMTAGAQVTTDPDIISLLGKARHRATRASANPLGAIAMHSYRQRSA